MFQFVMSLAFSGIFITLKKGQSNIYQTIDWKNQNLQKKCLSLSTQCCSVIIFLLVCKYILIFQNKLLKKLFSDTNNVLRNPKKGPYVIF